ncbi:hypothetical protein [Nocardia sp. NPDC005998]|uniref:hypothetical protein n=1 Tax=Nocardia sp. NPDC005998 TaxID=3156894 RepID=UPI0033B1D304
MSDRPARTSSPGADLSGTSVVVVPDRRCWSHRTVASNRPVAAAYAPTVTTLSGDIAIVAGTATFVAFSARIRLAAAV